jgi:MinD superfamily P-loop ATPase
MAEGTGACALMRVVVAGGKGGTGKTAVATALVSSLAGNASGSSGGQEPWLLDCDVEAPDAHVYLRPEFSGHRAVTIPIPVIDEAICDRCGRCAGACQFHALAVLPARMVTFPALCHGCGVCARICPRGAITEVPRRIGVIETGAAPGGIRFGRGVLDVGEPMAVPVIRDLLREIDHVGDGLPVILDAPPGTSCPVTATCRGADYALLVTEPTPFGLHDVRLMVEVVRQMGLPAGVVLNRAGIGDGGVERFCREAGLPLLLTIPFRREIAEGLARGIRLTEIVPGLDHELGTMWERIEREQAHLVH